MKYISPESKAFPEKFKDPEGFWTGAVINLSVIAYNTKLIPPQEAPKTYEDLLNPKWKEKIGISI